jgi:hypothetical protein
MINEICMSNVLLAVYYCDSCYSLIVDDIIYTNALFGKLNRDYCCKCRNEIERGRDGNG